MRLAKFGRGTLAMKNSDLINKMISYLLKHGLSEIDAESVRKDLVQMEAIAESNNQSFEEHMGQDYHDFCDDLLEVGYDIQRPKHKVKQIEAKESKLSMLFASLFIMIPPLALGLMAIYNTFNLSNLSKCFLYDGILFAIVAVIYVGIVLLEDKHRPNSKGIRWLLFGTTSHVAIFCFIFQSQLRIENIIDVYVTTVGLMALYFIFIDRRKVSVELLVFAIVYFSFYRFHMAVVYDPSNHHGVIEHNLTPWWMYALYIYLIPLFTVGMYSFKIFKMKVKDAFTIIFIGLSFMSLMILSDNADEKMYLTIYLLMPFVIIIDFIVAKINKKGNSMKLPFYLRLIILDIFIVILSTTCSFDDLFRYETLYVYTFMMIATVVISIIEHFTRDRIQQIDNE